MAFSWAHLFATYMLRHKKPIPKNWIAYPHFWVCLGIYRALPCCRVRIDWHMDDNDRHHGICVAFRRARGALATPPASPTARSHLESAGHHRKIQLRHVHLSLASAASSSFVSPEWRGLLGSSKFPREDTLYDCRDYGNLFRCKIELRSIRNSLS